MSDACRVQMDGGILDIGARCAIYGTALLAWGLGCLSMFNVSRATVISPNSPRTAKAAEDDMHEEFRSHGKTTRPVGIALNLMGIGMVVAAFIFQSKPFQDQAAKAASPNPSVSPQGPFTLFHAYTLLSLLWLISLAGMMIHVQIWVFNVIHRRSGRDTYRRKRRLIDSIWNGTHWYLLQVEMLGAYGLYVSMNHHKFPQQLCNIPIFDDDGLRILARVVYIIMLIPIVNLQLLCMPLVGTVWTVSWVATRLGNRDWTGRSVSPVVFNIFWLFVCGIIMAAIGITTEVLLFTNTDSQNVWSFGSLLALILLVLPAHTFIDKFLGDLYYMLAPEEIRYNYKPTPGNLGSQYEFVYHSQDEGIFKYNASMCQCRSPTYTINDSTKC